MQLDISPMLNFSTNIYQKYGKRLFDVVIVLFALLPFSFISCLLYVLVRFKLGAPVFFRQARLGYTGEEFKILKFRSMTDEQDESGALLPDEQRITSFGHFLRNSSLDEIPEIWLILKGQMSFVGPRPLPAIYKERYTPRQMQRHSVLPGLTGWAQVNGRNNVTWEDKFAMDLWYVENQSFGLDLKILFLTVKSVLWRENICAEGHATTTEFMGTSASVSPSAEIS